jgi:hypothetical protein
VRFQESSIISLSGFGILKNTNKKILKQMEVAALTILVYLLKKEKKKQSLIIKNIVRCSFR